MILYMYMHMHLYTYMHVHMCMYIHMCVYTHTLLVLSLWRTNTLALRGQVLFPHPFPPAGAFPGLQEFKPLNFLSCLYYSTISSEFN